MRYVVVLLFFGIINTASERLQAQDHPVLPIGAQAPPFSLRGIDNKIYSLESFDRYKILVIIFTCNHCPTAQAYEHRVMQLVDDYQEKGVGIVAVSPNDPHSIRLDELGYTDLSDSFEEMKIRASQRKFNFPYLYDGDTQTMAKAYGPVATPHVFIFDKSRILRFRGRIDDVERPTGTPNTHDTRDAIEELLKGKKVSVSTTKVFGCSIKWTEKSNWIEKAKADWAKEPVRLEMVDEAGTRELLKNSSEKLRFINIWATWCGPCVIEFPELVDINRMYRGRDFEFITICMDDTAKFEKALEFLRSKQASGKNYLFNMDNKYRLIEAVDPDWQGALPYTLIVEPGGKIYYRRQNTIDPALVKGLIVDHPLIGRYY